MSIAVNPRERDSRLFIDLSDQSRGLLSSASTQHKLLRLIGKRRYGPGSIRLDFKCPPKLLMRPVIALEWLWNDRKSIKSVVSALWFRYSPVDRSLTHFACAKPRLWYATDMPDIWSAVMVFKLARVHATNCKRIRKRTCYGNRRVVKFRLIQYFIASKS